MGIIWNIFFGQKYEIIKELGKGGFGRDFLVKKDNKEYVIKKIKISQTNKEEIDNYQKLKLYLSKINNDNVIKYYKFEIEGDYFNILMEYGGNSNLEQFISNHIDKSLLINEKIIENIIIQICMGLKEIHKAKLIHRDLTPDNIFINDENKIKIGDFGIATIINESNEFNYGIIGKTYYAAPEIEKGEPYNTKVDIYSLGCIIYELFTLNKYFIDKRIIKENYTSTLFTDIYNPKWLKLIDLLLKEDYHERPDIEEVLKYVLSINMKEEIEIIKKLGEGGFGEVFLIKKGNQNYALKKIPLPNKLLTEDKIKEYKEMSLILQTLNNENIIKYHEFDFKDDCITVLMEYGGDSDLKHFIEEYKDNFNFIKEEFIKNIILQICNGLKEIHKAKLIHRDLTPDNIFIDKNNNKVKIGDFSISKKLGFSNLYTNSQIGKHHYFSPELEKGLKYNQKADIYALGCIIYELLTLNEYYIDKRIDEKDCKIDANLYNPKWQELIDLLLKKDYHERPDIEEIYNMIKDY